MKKFIFTANVIAILFLVPATIVGYLHSDSQSTSKEATNEVAVKKSVSADYTNLVLMVKTF